jgi:hypothetical protein
VVGPPYVRADATALSLEVRPGGRLVEEWYGGGQVLATVTGLTTHEWVQLRGPFHLGNASATVEFAIVADGSGSMVRLGFSAYGLIDPATADGFGLAWQVLVGDHLKAFLEHGTRSGVASS